MKHLEEFHDPELAHRLIEEIETIVTRPWSIMEVCGGQTHAILRHGLDQLLPEQIRLLHGPGCPVCVTPATAIDAAIDIAGRPGTTLCTFGDMLRVPGLEGDLMSARSRGADVRILYSPLDAVVLAERHPDREIVFFAVGFETTGPANALAIEHAHRRQLSNFSVLVSQVLVPPAIEAIAGAPDSEVDAFLAAGHVCTVMGTAEYEPLVERFGIPVVVTGFEPLDVLDGVRRATRQLEAGEASVENAYARVVRPEGNPVARELLSRVFVPCDREWRGIGELPRSGWRLADEYLGFDAELRFDIGAPVVVPDESPCRAWPNS